MCPRWAVLLPGVSKTHVSRVPVLSTLLPPVPAPLTCGTQIPNKIVTTQKSDLGGGAIRC